MGQVNSSNEPCGGAGNAGERASGAGPSNGSRLRFIPGPSRWSHRLSHRERDEWRSDTKDRAPVREYDGGTRAGPTVLFKRSLTLGWNQLGQGPDADPGPAPRHARG